MSEPTDAELQVAAATIAAAGTPNKPKTTRAKAKAETAAVLAKTNSSSRIYVGCRLPHGITLTVGATSVVLKGLNSAVIVGTYGLTEVDEDFWSEWLKTHSDWPMVVNGLVFAQSKIEDLHSEAEELKDEVTSFDRLDPTSNGVEPAPKT